MTARRRFEGKAAVITGSAQGIGRTVAVTMAREGGKLALVDKSDLIHEVRGEITAAGGEAFAITADLEKYADCCAVMARGREQSGPDRHSRKQCGRNDLGEAVRALRGA